ncbi:hypothetical protein CXB51_011803 [Gossypium anomalum]|uniref:BHLH domain-containing protein n=1 Tax=Gossypium anomalum TaxID=47600 RepID=A0A8J6D0I2_9ROSI|nr:hypothetical protein CXB51_011803 [Gossypium anomalum]
MADLYGSAPYSNPETEEISTILNQLLHNSSSSSSSSSSCMQFKGKNIHSFPSQVPGISTPAANSGAGMGIPVMDRYRLGGLAVRIESEPRVNISDPETYFGANVKDSADNALSSACDFSYDSEVPDASEVPSNQERPRSSSKRSRAAEVHNLSEKRRRSRINEKMKALQNLIPNSNKTDKASMLDEAIEYLKQLQLQVQSFYAFLDFRTVTRSTTLKKRELKERKEKKPKEDDTQNPVLSSIGKFHFPPEQEAGEFCFSPLPMAMASIFPFLLDFSLLLLGSLAALTWSTLLSLAVHNLIVRVGGPSCTVFHRAKSFSNKSPGLKETIYVEEAGTVLYTITLGFYDFAHAMEKPGVYVTKPGNGRKGHMLSLRNGLSLYPMCLPGVPQPMQMPPTGLGYDEGHGFFSPNIGAGTFSSNEESSMNTPFNLSNPCTISNLPVVAPSVANMSNLEASIGFESPAGAHHGSFTHSTSSKEICKEGRSQIELEMNHGGNSSSSGHFLGTQIEVEVVPEGQYGGVS